ncbi:MAG: hypothetical protein AAB874_02350 [Patescibacteria group bacterium]
MRYLHKIKSLRFYILHTRHHFAHLLIGLAFAWFLREWWNEFSLKYLILALIGSEIIDVDHLLYIFVYGRHEWYAIEVKKFLRAGQLRDVWAFLSTNHKHNTALATHNVYFIGFFLVLSLVSFQYDWKASLVIFGAIVLHLLFDIADDLWVLGYLNDNWKRFRRKANITPLKATEPLQRS